MIVVVNRHHINFQGYFIGRPSPLGNPYMTPKDGTLDEVIQLYEFWLRGKIGSGDQRVIAALNEILKLEDDSPSKLKRVFLECFCKPKACHGDVIVKIIKEYREGKITW